MLMAAVFIVVSTNVRSVQARLQATDTVISTSQQVPRVQQQARVNLTVIQVRRNHIRKLMTLMIRVTRMFITMRTMIGIDTVMIGIML